LPKEDYPKYWSYISFAPFNFRQEIEALQWLIRLKYTQHSTYLSDENRVNPK